MLFSIFYFFDECCTSNYFCEELYSVKQKIKVFHTWYITIYIIRIILRTHFYTTYIFDSNCRQCNVDILFYCDHILNENLFLATSLYSQGVNDFIEEYKVQSGIFFTDAPDVQRSINKILPVGYVGLVLFSYLQQKRIC